MLTENEPIDIVEMRDDGNLAHTYTLKYVTMQQLCIYPSFPAITGSVLATRASH